MTIESSVAALTSATTALLTAVGVQQAALNSAIAAFNSVTERVNNGLNRVNNTPDAEKPISLLVQEALGFKQPTLKSGINVKRVNGQDLMGEGDIVIARSATSLNRILYDNRATLRATTSQVDDSTVVEGLGLFMWAENHAEPDDDETCFNTASGQWLLQVPAWELIDAWNLFDSSTTDDWREDEPARFAAYLLANK